MPVSVPCHSESERLTLRERDVDTYIIHVLHAQDLLAEVLKVVEGRLSSDGVHKKETHAVLHVEIPHCSELLLLNKTCTVNKNSYMCITYSICQT